MLPPEQSWPANASAWPFRLAVDTKRSISVTPDQGATAGVSNSTALLTRPPTRLLNDQLCGNQGDSRQSVSGKNPNNAVCSGRFTAIERATHWSGWLKSGTT